MAIFLPTGSAGAGLSRSDDSDDICQIGININQTVCNQSVSYLDMAKIVRNIDEDENQVTLMIILRDNVIDDDSIHYVLWYNNSYSKYKMDYSNKINYGICYNIDEVDIFQEVDDPVVNENYVMVTYPLIKTGFPNENIEAAVYELDGSFLWIDRIPNEKKGIGDDAKPIDNFVNPGQNKSSSPPDNNTPGFELAIFIIGISLMLCLRKKRF